MYFDMMGDFGSKAAPSGPVFEFCFQCSFWNLLRCVGSSFGSPGNLWTYNLAYSFLSEVYPWLKLAIFNLNPEIGYNFKPFVTYLCVS